MISHTHTHTCYMKTLGLTLLLVYFFRLTTLPLPLLPHHYPEYNLKCIFYALSGCETLYLWLGSLEAEPEREILSNDLEEHVQKTGSEWNRRDQGGGGHTKQEWVLSWELVNLNHLKVLEHNLHHRFTPCTQGGRNAYPMLKRSAPSSSRGARSFRWGGDIWQGTGPIHWRKGSCAWLLANTCSNQGWVSAPMWLQQGTNSVQFSTSSRANMAVGMLFLPPQAVHQSLLCRRELGTAPLLLTQHFGPLWSLKAV